MSYGELTKLFENKVRNYGVNECAFALQDCHDTLKIHRDLPTDHPYYIKLWAEIDAIRSRQYKLAKAAA